MLRNLRFLVVLLFSLDSIIAWAAPRIAAAEEPAVYELRTYTCAPDKLDALHERFRNHTMDIFSRHGMENVAYWVPIEQPQASNTLIYLLRHKSREAAQKSWDSFRNDPKWQRVAADSEATHGRILAQAPDSTYLIATDYSPETGAVKQDHLYELRIYTAADGKLDALHNRFRDYTDKIFAKHGMQAMGYWKPMDDPASENVMIYILEHRDEESARSSWQAFGSDADWQAARRASEVDGRLTARRPERVYMKPTTYSPME